MARSSTGKSKRSFISSKSKSAKPRRAPKADLNLERGLTAFGERLVGTLQAKGMSDSDLAKALGIAQPNIHTLKYKTDRPRHKTVLKIAKALGVPAESLLPPAALLAAPVVGDGTKVYIVIENKQGRQTIRLA